MKKPIHPLVGGSDENHGNTRREPPKTRTGNGSSNFKIGRPESWAARVLAQGPCHGQPAVEFEAPGLIVALFTSAWSYFLNSRTGVWETLGFWESLGVVVLLFVNFTQACNHSPGLCCWLFQGLGLAQNFCFRVRTKENMPNQNAKSRHGGRDCGRGRSNCWQHAVCAWSEEWRSSPTARCTEGEVVECEQETESDFSIWELQPLLWVPGITLSLPLHLSTFCQCGGFLPCLVWFDARAPSLIDNERCNLSLKP